MSFLRTIAIVLAVMTLFVGSALATSERSMTPPDDYDGMADGYFNIRHMIGYGDIKDDPMAHGLTVYDENRLRTNSIPELGDSVVSTAAVAGLCAAALAGVAIADRKRRNLSK